VVVLVIDACRGRGIGKVVVFDFAERLGMMGYRYALAYVSPENYKALARAV
jgi:ribosomal protein S18 acetylase RimI-like enzyme